MSEICEKITLRALDYARSATQLVVQGPDMIRVGLISDTHGLLRPEAREFLRGSNFIIHGGDIGRGDLLEELAAIAPLTAVRGNNDKGAWAERLPNDEWLRVGAVDIYVIHDLAELPIEPKAAGVRVVISGHSHRPSIKESDGVLFVNPGSSGPRRFKLPIAVGELLIDGTLVTARTVDLGLPPT